MWVEVGDGLGRCARHAEPVAPAHAWPVHRPSRFGSPAHRPSRFGSLEQRPSRFGSPEHRSSVVVVFLRVEPDSLFQCRGRSCGTYENTRLKNGEPVQSHDKEPLLTPSEVAAMFRVNPKTVTRWARSGKISTIRTLGGHRRYRASEVREALAQSSDER
jgi:excisionase family DNA binding protein